VAAKKRRAGVTFAQLQKIALALPGMEEGSSYGTPAFRVRKKLVARMFDDASLVLLTTLDEKELLLEAKPSVYHTTPHYDGHGAVLIRLAKVHPRDLAQLVESVWRRAAPKKLVADYDAGAG